MVISEISTTQKDGLNTSGKAHLHMKRIHEATPGVFIFLHFKTRGSYHLSFCFDILLCQGTLDKQLCNEQTVTLALQRDDRHLKQLWVMVKQHGEFHTH